MQKTMKRSLFILVSFSLCILTPLLHVSAAQRNPKPIARLLDRIGGKGMSRRIITELDESISGSGDRFVISQRRGKPLVQGSSLMAISTGINWYLNHYAHVNLSWNKLTADLTGIDLPLPQQQEEHSCRADYRYYLNYCTFGYSMSTWTWERWEQEIDWMALHGINMPLQIVGLESVWREFLIRDCHYREEDAEAFIPGPAFTPWWGMNNLEGWGNLPGMMSLWCQRQKELGRRICERERELGMQPVLPGFSGMVPSNFEAKTGIRTEKANLWCQFQRPTILDPSSPDFARLAASYYARLSEVMGESRYYSMDPFHEGGTISSGRYAEGYEAIYHAMDAHGGKDSRWVIQQWQWAGYQALSLKAVPEGRLIVLDLFSDGHPAFETFNGYAPQEAVYCTIPNFGGRTGFMGRLPSMAEGYFQTLKQYPSLRGIGAAPEAIESVPVVYDLLYELPWMAEQPDINQWIKDYAWSRYGMRSREAELAWQGILETAMDERSGLQGPHEAVMCARPSLQVDRVSSWGGTKLFYDPQKLGQAVRHLLVAAGEMATDGSVGAANMSYDLCDLTRQMMSDQSLLLLRQMHTAYSARQMQEFNSLKERFLLLLRETDTLLGTNALFRLGHWTEAARKIADEVVGFLPSRNIYDVDISSTHKRLADWLEYDNARRLITTWGDMAQAEGGGLRDYSYRQWQGLLASYYQPRWEYFFQHMDEQTPWFYSEWNWAHELQGEWGADSKGSARNKQPQRFSPIPYGNTLEVAKTLINKYVNK